MTKPSKKNQQPQKNVPENRPARDFVQVDLPLVDCPVLLSREQACQILGGISRSTLYRIEKTGTLDACHINLAGSVRYHKQALIRWINSQVNMAPLP